MSAMIVPILLIVHHLNEDLLYEHYFFIFDDYHFNFKFVANMTYMR